MESSESKPRRTQLVSMAANWKGLPPMGSFKALKLTTIHTVYAYPRRTAHGSGGSLKGRKPIGEGELL